LYVREGGRNEANVTRKVHIQIQFLFFFRIQLEEFFFFLYARESFIYELDSKLGWRHTLWRVARRRHVKNSNVVRKLNYKGKSNSECGKDFGF